MAFQYERYLIFLDQTNFVEQLFSDQNQEEVQEEVIVPFTKNLTFPEYNSKFQINTFKNNQKTNEKKIKQRKKMTLSTSEKKKREGSFSSKPGLKKLKISNFEKQNNIKKINSEEMSQNSTGSGLKKVDVQSTNHNSFINPSIFKSINTLRTCNLNHPEASNSTSNFTLNIKTKNPYMLSDKMKVFFSKFCNQIKQEFGNDLPINLSLEQLDTKSDSLKKDKNPIEFNSSFVNWLDSIKKMQDKDFLETLNFQKNYTLIFKNLFGKASESKGHLLKLVYKNLLGSLKNTFVSKLESESNLQSACIEVGLMLFNLNLDLPKELYQQMTEKFLLLFWMIVIFNSFETKILFNYFDSLSNDRFLNDEVFDLDVGSALSPDLKKYIYCFCWFTFQVINSFNKITRIKNCAKAKFDKDFIKKLFWIPETLEGEIKDLPALSFLIRSMEINQMQKLHLLLKNKIYKSPKLFKQTCTEKSKKIYFYFSDSNKMGSINVSIKSLNYNPFKKQFMKKNKKNLSFRRMKKHQEMSIFIGPRLKKFLIDKKENQSPDSTPTYLFNLSSRTNKSDRLPGNVIFQSTEKIHENINKHLLSSYKIPVYLLQTLKCTEEYESFSDEFLFGEFIELELKKILTRENMFKNDILSMTLLNQLFLPKNKLKLPWSVLELLNYILFVDNLKPKIFANYLHN